MTFSRVASFIKAILACHVPIWMVTMGTLSGTVALTDNRTHLVCEALRNKLAMGGVLVKQLPWLG